MKKKQFRLKGSYYFVIWSVILVAAVYLLIRFAALSFSEDMGQAKMNLKDRIITDLYIKAMESGSSFLEYRSKGEEAIPFPVNLVANAFTIRNFTIDNEDPVTTTMETLNSNNDKGEVTGVSASLAENKNIMNKNKKTIKFLDITKGYLTKEYVLTNGASSNSFLKSIQTTSQKGKLPIKLQNGDIALENEDKENVNKSSTEVMNSNGRAKFTLEQLKDVSFFVRNFYIVDGATKVTDSLFDAKKLLEKDEKIKQDNKKPQILIYHTHAHETYKDSREGKMEDTVVGVGSYLTKILEDTYGYQVIHDKTSYDLMDGVFDRSLAYNRALTGITNILKKNPSIEIVIDLHRDGASKRVTMIDGKETAQIMLFNGLSRDQDGPITYLDNPYLQDNLAFSLQLQMKSIDLYPGLFYKNYLNCYRYNQHVRKKSLLIELGTEENTLESAKNAMNPFADVLNAVLQGK